MADHTRNKGHTTEEIRAASKHVGSCASCQVRFRNLVRAILSERANEIPCAEARDHFLDYRAGEQATEVPAELIPTRHHLQTCPDCAAEYSHLAVMLRIAEDEPFPSPLESASFGVSFLRGSAPLWRRLGDRVSRLTQSLRLRLGPRTATWGGWLGAWPQLQLVPAPALRGAGDLSAGPPPSLVIPDEASGVQLRVAISKRGSSQADLLVALEALAPARKLGRVHVSLEDSNRRLLEKQFGKQERVFSFERLEPAVYWVVVQEDEHAWEFSLPILASEEDPDG